MSLGKICQHLWYSAVWAWVIQEPDVIIDQMEARGIISGANGSKPRDVLVSHADLSRPEN